MSNGRKIFDELRERVRDQVGDIERVGAELGDQGLGCGRLVAVVGNLGALNEGRRSVDKDLNRLWWPRLSAHLPDPGGPPGCHEEWEKARPGAEVKRPQESPEDSPKSK